MVVRGETSVAGAGDLVPLLPGATHRGRHTGLFPAADGRTRIDRRAVAEPPPAHSRDRLAAGSPGVGRGGTAAGAAGATAVDDSGSADRHSAGDSDPVPRSDRRPVPWGVHGWVAGRHGGDLSALPALRPLPQHAGGAGAAGRGVAIRMTLQ